MKNHGIVFGRFGTMIDCSRNAVMTVESVKRWIDITSDIGYNTIMLYMEDTYEIQGEPYFGHYRGKYSADELREIDDYAFQNGMEFIPCIQTLAHLNGIFHWNEYKSRIWDCDDILLADEQGTYNLIDKMFKTFRENLRTKIINIGMDEAHNLGLGKYLDQYGFKERTEILIEHLKKVAHIAEKYDLQLIMWGDMFVRLANGGEYYVTDFKAPDAVKDSIPDNVSMIYWDYYSLDKNKYNHMIQAHKSIKENIWFAGGLWTWGSFVPQNIFSIEANKAALRSCIENGVKDVFLTLWGDDGGECSPFSVLPSLYHASQTAQGITDDNLIRDGFKQKFGIDFDDFMLLDLPQTPSKSEIINDDKDLRNPEKYMLYCDCFMGQYDYTVKGQESQQYAKCAKKLKMIENNAKFGYLFKKERILCEVLSSKYELGVRTRKAYVEKDIEKLRSIILDYDIVIALIEAFYQAFKAQWFKDNKPYGFDIQDMRLGGLMLRINSCKVRLKEFVDGKIERIEELEEPVLNYNGLISKNNSPIFSSKWSHDISANIK